MRFWPRVLLLLCGLIVGFTFTVAISGIGPSPWWVWLLWLGVGLWLGFLPRLPAPGPRFSVTLCYGSFFVALWLWSNPIPGTGVKDIIRESLLGLSCALGLAGLWGTFAALRLKNASGVVAALLPLFVLAWLVATFSSSTGAGGHMVHWMLRLGLSQDTAELATAISRKAMHFLFYGAMGWLAFRVVVRSGASKAALMAIAFVAMHACTDEIRQSSYPDRTGSLWDVLLDLAGAGCAVGLASRRKAKSESA